MSRVESTSLLTTCHFYEDSLHKGQEIKGNLIFMRKIQILATFCLLAFSQDIHAVRGHSRDHMYYTHYFQKHTFYTMQAQDYQAFVSFIKGIRWNKDIPGCENGRLVRKDFRQWFEKENLRRNGQQRSLYHLYEILAKKQNKPDTRIGYVQLGSLPAALFDLESNIFRFIKDKKGLGIATFLPIFKDDCSKQDIVGALEDIVKFVRALRTKGYQLPEQSVVPNYLVGFFSYSNPIVKHLTKAGFNYNLYEDYKGEFRVLAYHPIHDEETPPPTKRISPACRELIDSL